MNGKKGPNQAGKDIGFMTVFYPTDSEVVMPIPLNKDSAKSQTYVNALKVCKNVGSDVRLPNKEELAAIGFNKNLLDISIETFYAATQNWKMVLLHGCWSKGNFDGGIRVRCIKR